MERRIVDYDWLIERLDANHHRYNEFLVTLRSSKKGMLGELRADREWRDMQLTITHYLLHDFTTKNALGYTHQIDTLLLCEHFIMVVELKDIGGVVSFNEQKGEMSQTWSDGSVKYYTHPMYQVLRHQEFVERELESLNLQIPVISVVIMTDLSVRFEDVTTSVPILKLSQLRGWFSKLVATYPKVLDVEQLALLHNQLLSRVERFESRLKYRDFAFLKGVVCEICRVQMLHERCGFRCPVCGRKKVKGIYEAMHAYRILENEWITNRELRAYVGVESIHTSNKMLKRIGLVYEGSNRNRKYYIPADILQQGK